MDIKLLEEGNIVHVQSVMHTKKRDALVRLTGETNTKDAIMKAINFYIENQEEKK